MLARIHTTKLLQGASHFTVGLACFFVWKSVHLLGSLILLAYFDDDDSVQWL